MATRVVAIATLVLAVACCYGTSAPTPAPEATGLAPAPATNGCFMALTNMSDCLTFVEDGSKLVKPDKGCCPELAGLVDSNPICLCQLLGNPDSIGIKINLNKALKLPSVCGVTTPPVTACAAVGVPISVAPSPGGGSLSPGIAPGEPDVGPSNGATASSPGGPSSSSEESSTNPSGNNNGVSGIHANVSVIFIFGLSILYVSVFF